jgi:hypothetical protein
MLIQETNKLIYDVNDVARGIRPYATVPSVSRKKGTSSKPIMTFNPKYTTFKSIFTGSRVEKLIFNADSVVICLSMNYSRIFYMVLVS